jgi:hypothetical protein
LYHDFKLLLHNECINLVVIGDVAEDLRSGRDTDTFLVTKLVKSALLRLKKSLNLRKSKLFNLSCIRNCLLVTRHSYMYEYTINTFLRVNQKCNIRSNSRYNKHLALLCFLLCSAPCSAQLVLVLS